MTQTSDDSAPKEMVDVFTDVEIDKALATNPGGYTIARLGEENPRILTLTADLSAVLADFRERHPERYVELGIAETNSISVAAGLAACGYLPYIFSMSPFGVLKCAEQLRTDVAYNHLPVRLVGRLTGLAMGYFGTSHHAVEDIAIARTLTNLTVIAPADSNAVMSLLRATVDLPGPAYIRLAEGAEPVYETPPRIEFGRWPHLRGGPDITLVGHGIGTGLAVRAAAQLEGQGIEADVYDAAYLKPFDENAIIETARRTGRILAVEDHNEIGGLFSIVAEVAGRRKLPVDLDRVALPDVDLEVGAPAELYEYYGLTVDNVVRKALALIDGEHREDAGELAAHS
ncbi:transketolase family protein [Amycolatopsis taiwanensis]|uniref:Transketolase n=1 Tax=Amycolatopsis taiwanensis TaxID=342230 RepID=A0A9W6VG61_9PSEU|nr:transketolase C-terminal domain-containing protein [Amycolatopsis taiwanensis]GLY65604.1 transketolase [Amycolatopsis taiwanensis]